MKICLFGTPPKSLDDIRSYSQLWHWYLPKALDHLGIAYSIVGWVPRHLNEAQMLEYFRDADLGGADHIVAAGVRYFSTVPPSVVALLRERVPGAVTQTHDGSMLDNVPCDLNFTVKDDEGNYPKGSPNRLYERHHAKNRYVGWAADAQLCTPQQDPKILRILVDHCTYTHANTDYSLQVLLELRHFVRSGLWKDRYEQVVVRRLVNNAVETVDLEAFSIEPYNRLSCTYPQACAEYSQAHIFMPTHQESVGLCALETAMAGALVVTPNGFIAPDRLATVNHVAWERSIAWPQVLAAVDPAACRARALPHSWEQVAKNIVQHLRDFTRA